MGFIQVQSGNQAGFKLIVNFMDEPGEADTFALHEINFTYLTQAAPGFDMTVGSIRRGPAIQNLTIEIRSLK